MVSEEDWHQQNTVSLIENFSNQCSQNLSVACDKCKKTRVECHNSIDSELFIINKVCRDVVPKFVMGGACD